MSILLIGKVDSSCNYKLLVSNAASPESLLPVLCPSPPTLAPVHY